MTEEPSDESQLRIQASRIAARIELLDVRGVSVKADLIRQRDPGRQLSFSLDTEARPEWGRGDPAPSSFVTSAAFTLTLRMIGDEDDETEDDLDDEDDEGLVARLHFELQGLYALEMREGDEPVEASEIEAFALTTGLFALYPFAREWTRDITSRLGLPPLTLPVMQLKHDGPAKYRKK